MSDFTEAEVMEAKARAMRARTARVSAVQTANRKTVARPSRKVRDQERGRG